MNEPTLTSALPRIGMVSTHGYVAAEPPLGAADTGGTQELATLHKG